MTGKREQKKRIKDCLSQLKYLDSVYAAEIKKPEAEQDADLLEDCLETMAYLHDVVESLSRQTQVQRSGVGNRIMLRRVVIAAIVLAALMIGMSIAEAAGFRVWSALIHWDSRYLHITYVSNEQPALTTYPVSDDLLVFDNEELTLETIVPNEIVCNSIDEAIDYLGTSILLPSRIPNGMQTSEIIYYNTDLEQSGQYLMIRWEGDGNYIFYSVTLYEDSDWSASDAFISDQESLQSLTLDNLEFLIVGNRVTWNTEFAHYTMETSLTEQAIYDILISLSCQ